MALLRSRSSEGLIVLGLLGSSACSSVLGLDDFAAAGDGGGSATSTGVTTGNGTTAGSGATTGTEATTGPGGAGGSGTGAGGAGSSTGAGGAGGSGTGAGGAGGSSTGTGGGGGDPLGCTALNPFEIFSALELGGAADDEVILASQRPPDENRVHVAVPLGGQQIAARTVRTSGQVELSQIVRFPFEPDGVDRRAYGSYATPDAFHVYGGQNNVAGEWVFPADSDIGNPAEWRPYAMPSSCTRLYALSVSLTEDGTPGFAATCGTSNDQAILFGGRVASAPPEFSLPPAAFVGGDPPADRMVRVYLRFGPEHVIFTASDDFNEAVPFLRRGTTAAELGVAEPVFLPADESAIIVAGPTVGGLTMLGLLHADPSTIFTPQAEGAYETGMIGPGDLDAFVEDAVTRLPGQFTFPSLADIAPVRGISGGVNGFVGGAVSNFDFDAPIRVRLYLWDPGALPLVVGFPVFEASGPVNPLTATATRAGFGAILAVWTEDVSGGHRVRGSRVQCAN